MRLAPFGAEPAWGPGSQVDTLTQTSRSRSGTTRVVELGKPTESWSLAWPEGASQFQIRQGADPDYLAVSGGNYLATREDVSQLLRGFTELTKSGQTPCVALEDIPTTTTTITDRSRFLYGRLTGSIRTEVTTGQYGSHEVVRVESVTVEGIP